MPLKTFDKRNIDFDIESGAHELKIGGTLIQWGQQLSSNTNVTTITFDKAYSSTPYVYLTVSGVTRTLDVRTAQLVSVGTTDFSFFVTGANGGSNYYSGVYINWIAIGTI